MPGTDNPCRSVTVKVVGLSPVTGWSKVAVTGVGIRDVDGVGQRG